jgi:hypothetical protein
VRALATKSTHKKKNYNKKELAKKLDRLAEKVSSKDIFVVAKHEDFFCVLNYKTKQPIIVDIPNKHIADRLCSKFNHFKCSTKTIKNIESHIRTYHRLLTETIFFHHTLSNSTDEVTLEATRHRLEITNARLKQTAKKISSP